MKMKSEILSNRTSKTEQIIAIASITAFIATLSSLYLSQIMGLIPCQLCWYQRILMYPLTLILSVSFFYKTIRPEAVILPILGSIIALYHSIIQIIGSSACSIGGGCSSVLLRLGGIFSIPNLSLIAFTIISVCTAILYIRQNRNSI